MSRIFQCRPSALVVGALTLLLTLPLFYYARSDAEQHGRLEFVHSSVQMRSAVVNRMSTYINAIRQIAVHVSLQPTISGRDFSAYIDSIGLHRNYPGLQVVGYVRASALGHVELNSESKRREAMERARDTAEPAMTSKLVLVSSVSSDRPEGFLIYVPVYREGWPIDTVRQRRAALRGFIFSSFRSKEFLQEIGQEIGGVVRSDGPPLDRSVAIAVYDGVTPDTEHLLYNGIGEVRSRYQQLSTVTLAGRTWTLLVKSLPSLEARSGYKVAWLVLIVGLAFSGIIFKLVLSAERSAESERSLRLREESARGEAEKAVKLREDLLAMVSHDLRNPLSSILMHAAFAHRSPNDHALAAKALGAIERAAKRMFDLIQNLLDLEKLEGSRFTLEKAPHELNEILDSMFETFHPLSGEKGILLEVDKPFERIEVLCDRVRLLQVLANLLGNALKFTPPGGRIGLQCSVLSDGLLFSVSDTGPGITLEQMAHIFDRYWQARQTSRQGNGLGLSIAKGIVEAHGGKIWVESRVSEGSTFYFKLPSSAIYSRMREYRPAAENWN